ncbi:hypothetical protein TVAG_189430 [Trichomonas vaginalis G3]|uniref:Uncharacterized protein n=1 Tax=Trichomonas vaginalis (strain ATCC PRA-98 / G3) TaxID=412133 RepID=A2F1P7_TRIV3|nr:hypothetical protein TVAG_189430 [Trichomonas vaginalis G3]|eukprot:XP_001314009.1 hypothetical protein [Trichomonas vaginalis G3]
MNLSNNEFEAYTLALKAGIRGDGRRFDESRKLIVQEITTPGVANVQLGNTRVTAITTARLAMPALSTPKKGTHNIYIFNDTPVQKSTAEAFQTYFRMIWKSCRILEDESLCVKVGEKVWMLTTRLIIHDDDGGILEAGFAAILASLGSLRFPSFDANTGVLFSPLHHRVHKIAFGVRAILVTVSFFEDKIVADPTSVETLISTRFARFVFDEWGNQIYLDSNRMGDYEQSLELASNIAKEWFKSISEQVDNFNPELTSVGSPADFADYIPTQFEPQKSLGTANYQPIEVWYGDSKLTITLDMDIKFEEEKVQVIDSSNKEDDWLLSSLI